MTNSLLTPATINQRNSEFWEAQIQIIENRIADPRLIEQAMTELDSEALRGVPMYCRKTFESALEQAAKAKETFHIAITQKGGRAPKTDSLGQRIDQIVETNQTINTQGLWHQLRKEVGGGLIVSIDPDSNEPGFVRKIYYNAGDGKIKTAPVSGLKHRLARAKAKFGLAS